MPSIRVKCPLCPEMCSENGLGKHLTSKVHADALRKNNEPLKTFLQTLKDNTFHQYMNRPPLFNVGKTDSFYICMTCKKCYKNGEGCTRSSKHYEKSPACRKARIEDLESFLFPVIKPNIKNNMELSDQIKDNNNKIIALEKGRTQWMDRLSAEQDVSDRLKKLLSMICGNDFDADEDDHLKKLEDFLNEKDDNKGYYCGIKFKEDDEDY